MRTPLDASRDYELLLSYLPWNFEELADEHGQLETKFGNAKITTASELLRFFFVHVGAELPLRQTVALVAEAGGPSIAPMRLHMKMRRAEPFLHALVVAMCSEFSLEECSPQKWAGYEMHALDASTVCGPGALGPDARLHARIRLSDLSIVSAEVTDASGGETFRRHGFTEGQLGIGDRGYCNERGIRSVVNDGADVLVRYNRGALPLIDARGRTLDVVKWARSLRSDEVHEQAAFIVGHGNEAEIGCRLLIARLPEEQAAEARKRLERQLGKKNVSAESREMAGYVVLFTTTPASRLSAQRCMAAYRLRWQVELFFKRWKSLGGAARLPNTRPDTIVAWLYIKVLLTLIVEKIGSATSEPSPPQILPHPPRARAPRNPSTGSTAMETRHVDLAHRRRSGIAAQAL